MRKSITILLFFTILFSFLLVSCTDSDGNFEDIKNVTFDYDTTPYLDEAVIRMENFSFQFLDCLLVPADDYGENDCLMIRDLLEDIIIIKPSFLKPVVGAYKSVGGDGYLLMLLNFDPEEDLAERGPFEPRMKIQAIDNFGEEAVLMYNSLHKSTVDAEFPYGILIFKANYDADTIFLCLTIKSLSWISIIPTAMKTMAAIKTTKKARKCIFTKPNAYISTRPFIRNALYNKASYSIVTEVT